MKQHITTKAPFDLRNQNSFFGGWPVIRDTPEEFAIVIAFPVEGWRESAAVVVSQVRNGVLTVETEASQQAVDQTLACLSLDVDDKRWPEVGKQDKVIAYLQEKYSYLRPVLFHSPYEAAAGFIIGQRISVKQRQAIQKRMAEQLGERFEIEGKAFYAFPGPQKLLEIAEFAGLNPNKIERLHGVAEAALAGKLDRAKLLALPLSEALIQLEALNGIGPFYARGILYRGAGIVNDITDDDLTKYAVEQAYRLPRQPSQKEVIKIAENWEPYRMWCEVLVHVWMRREIGMPKRR
jgi:DNA-3-methyladenine glycosylase II